MKHFLYTFLLISLSLSAQKTEIKYLSGTGSDDAVEWDFFCTDGRKSGEWTKIKVPSCWEMQGFGTLNYGHDKPKADESGLYKTTFHAQPEWKGKRIFIVFDGSMTDTEVKINGRQVGAVHQGAFYRFKYEITKYLKSDADNLLEVRVNKMSSNTSVNAAERQCDFWVFGGVFRPVFLEIVPTDYIEYTAVDARQDGALRVDVFMDKKISDVEADVEIRDLNGSVVGKINAVPMREKTNKISVSGKIDGVKAWSAEFPNLYTAVISVKKNGKTLHEITDRIGFRTIEVVAHDGVYINGVKMRFKGVNRHSHWPTTGRTTSKRLSIDDVKLMKEMNMNAVRMSHYPPDKHFLEVCDSLGMYVIDELCAWQYPPYDTEVGTKLVGEMLKRDLNRPSVIFWSNGNEGGFNFDLDSLFPGYDLQKRAVLHPWSLSSNINTVHYISYNSGIGNMFHGRDIFMPTETLHGLYDGGHGAGLDDYWNLMMSNQLSAGLFLWDFVDQAVLRDDKNGFLDTDKDHGADGILGPYREKEGSFYTIKEIWSPLQLERLFLTPHWNRQLTLENRYAFTNTNECTFSYRLSRVTSFAENKVQNVERQIPAPNIPAGEHGRLQLNLPSDWIDYDFLYVTIKDPYEKELFTWSYEIAMPERFINRMLPLGNISANVSENSTDWILEASARKITIDKHTGLLKSVETDGKIVPLANGPILVNRDLVCKSVEYKNTGEIVATYTANGRKTPVYTFIWAMHNSGILELTYNYSPQDKVNMAGITFDFPEKNIEGVTMLANGPYRVYNNRMKGGALAIHEKKYNNTVTGESWEYPEFKGYYSLFYAMRLNCETPFEVYCGKPDVILHLFTPEAQRQYDASRNNTLVEYPKGNISFMNAIPAVGTKFAKSENFGPQSQLHRAKGHDERNNLQGKLYFKF